MGWKFERRLRYLCASVAEWTNALDCKSSALTATEVRILPGAFLQYRYPVVSMQNFSLRELDKDTSFDPLDIYENAPFTQAGFYGNWQESLGRGVSRFLVSDGGMPLCFFQLVVYPLLLGKRYGYVPYGPVLKIYSEELLFFLRQELVRIAKEKNLVFIRLDFTPLIEDNRFADELFIRSSQITYHAAHFQPRAEWVMALDTQESELFSSLDKKTRYSIRTAEKKGVAVEIVRTNFLPYCERFCVLMEETAIRNRFSLHPEAYYEGIFKGLASDHAFLSVARLGDLIIAVDLIIVYGKTANYVFGASSSAHRDMLPVYAAQWAAIGETLRRGCARYNFGGISFEDAYKGWEGLTMFKKQFVGSVLRHSDFYDVVRSRSWYRLYVLRKYFQHR